MATKLFSCCLVPFASDAGGRMVLCRPGPVVLFSTWVSIYTMDKAQEDDIGAVIATEAVCRDVASDGVISNLKT